MFWVKKIKGLNISFNLFFIMKILPLEFSFGKNSRVNLGGYPTPQKMILYMLVKLTNRIWDPYEFPSCRKVCVVGGGGGGV